MNDANEKLQMVFWGEINPNGKWNHNPFKFPELDYEESKPGRYVVDLKHLRLKARPVVVASGQSRNNNVSVTNVSKTSLELRGHVTRTVVGMKQHGALWSADVSEKTEFVETEIRFIAIVGKPKS